MLDGCTVSDTFLVDNDVNWTGKGSSAKFASPTWLVQMESPGARKVYHYPKGFKFLNFHSVHGELPVSTYLVIGYGLTMRSGKDV